LLDYQLIAKHQIFAGLRFKTSAPVTSWWVGSIPMHFRHTAISISYK